MVSNNIKTDTTRHDTTRQATITIATYIHTYMYLRTKVHEEEHGDSLPMINIRSSFQNSTLATEGKTEFSPMYVTMYCTVLHT